MQFEAALVKGQQFWGILYSPRTPQEQMPMYPGEIFIKVSSFVGSSVNMKNLLMVLLLIWSEKINIQQTAIFFKRRLSSCPVYGKGVVY